MTAELVQVIGPQQWVDRIAQLLVDVNVPVEGHTPVERVAKCGTPSGYNAHRRRKENPCVECRQAASRYHLERARQLGRMPHQPAPCGTDAGYDAHLRRGETTCPSCRKAHNAAGRAWYALRKTRTV